MVHTHRHDGISGRAVSTPLTRDDSHEHRSGSSGGPENHLALVYETPAEHLSAVIPYVRRGLEQNERVMYLADEHSPERLRTVFRNAGIDIDSAALTIHSAVEQYMPSGTFDVEAMIDHLDELVETVTDGPYDRLRLTGEMTWALRSDAETLDRLVEYESQINHFYTAQEPVVGLCQYDRTKFDSDLLHAIIRSHPQQVYDATVMQNFSYRSPEESSAIHPAADATDAFIDAHLDRLRAVTQQQQYRLALTELSASTHRLREAEREEILAQAVATTQSVLSSSVVAVYSYDEATDSLEESAWLSADGAVDPTALPDAYQERINETLITGEPAICSVAESGRDPSVPSGVPKRGIAYPLEQGSVLFVGWTRPSALSEADTEFVQAVAHATDAALRRAAYGRTLDQRTDQLRHLRRINRAIRDITRTLVCASSRDEIEAQLCNRLVAIDGYRFAWIGDRDPLSGAMTPRQWAGDGELYLDSLYLPPTDDEVTATGDDGESVSSPARTALETHAPAFVPNAVTTTAYRTWRRSALENGLYTAFSVPLVYNAAEYGVLTVYSGQPNTLTEMEREVLEELGAAVAYAIDCTETQADLYSTNLTELDVHLPGTHSRLARLAARIDGTLDVETVLPDAAGQLRLFFTVADVPAERVVAAAERSTSVQSIRQVVDHARGTLFEAVLRVSKDVSEILSSTNGSVTRLTAMPTGVDLTFEVPRRTNVRAVAERAKQVFPGATVESIRRTTQPVQTRGSFLSLLSERLTDRQAEALRLAYYSGYFEWPRDSSASDVAASMGVSQPTFTNHLRSGERKLFELLFGE
jgi:DNA-binding CsgD family transcriptional regulator